MSELEYEDYINKDGNQMGIIINVPNSTIKIDLKITMLDSDNEQHVASQTLYPPQIYEARILGDQWEAENIKYIINPDFIREINHD